MLNCTDVPVAVPVERWDLESVSASSEALQSNMLRFGAFMDDAASFDSLAFKMAHGEAVGLDPQSRILLEGVYNAMQVKIYVLNIRKLLVTSRCKKGSL